VSGSRVDRKDYSYPGYPPMRRSLYHYHRHDYPSHRIFYWITWPNCCRPICYSWGPSYTFGFFWPYYHRKFIFISFCGYWPDYNYRRYYWYGWHPYAWYGYYPPGYVIAGPTYNYYYYNRAPEGEALDEAQQKLEDKPPAEPAPETRADRYFDQAVKAFDTGNYTTATQKFHEAMLASPEDIVLPFACVQALFAGGDYPKAAEALRNAMTRISPEKEGVFYPRGLYSDDSVLQDQIKQLEQAVQQNPLNADLKLLLGYQLLGVNRFDEAGSQLQHAILDENNRQAATALLIVMEKLEKADTSNAPKPDIPGENADEP
jgi:tetratricopeptide (TPR) repeat protein